MRAWLSRSADNPNVWRGLLSIGAAMTMAAYAVQMFLQPHSLHGDHWAIQDDARQFLTWTPRLVDPSLLKGDLQADYWHSVSPWLYRMPFEIMAGIGIAPVLFGRLLPLLLLPLLAVSTWRLATRLTERASAAFITSASIFIACIYNGAVFSATPRAFALPLILFFLAGLVGEKRLQMVVTLGLLALFYPATAIACLAMLGLSRIHFLPRPRLDLSPRSVITIVMATALVGLAGLTFKADVARWKPTVTFAQAKNIPAMNTPAGRSAIVQEDGGIGWVSSQRMGYLPAIFHNKKSLCDAGALKNILLFLPMLILALNGLRRPDIKKSPRLYNLVIIATFACWAIAAAVAFRLHLPSRYSQLILTPVEALAIGEVLAGLLVHNRLVRPVKLGASILIAFSLAYGFLHPHPSIVRPADPDAIAAMRTLPINARIAGIDDDLSFGSALTGRAILASTEQAVPYQLGYYLPFRERLTASVTALRSPDKAMIAEFIRHYGVTSIAIDRSVIPAGELPMSYKRAVPELPAIAGTPSILAVAPAECVQYQSIRTILFNADCLLGWTQEK